MFQTHFLENLLECVERTKTPIGTTLIWQQTGTSLEDTPPPLLINEDVRKRLLECTAPYRSGAFWHFLKAHCLSDAVPLQALLTWSRLDNHVASSSSDQTLPGALAGAFSPRALLGKESGTPVDLPTLWKEATSTLAKVTEEAFEEPFLSYVTHAAPRLSHAQKEAALKQAPLFAAEVWMVSTLKIMEEYHLEITQGLFETWCASTRTWSLPERSNFFGALGRAMTHLLHTSRHPPRRKWSDLLARMPLDQEAWIWLTPFLDAEFVYADRALSFIDACDVFKETHHALTATPSAPNEQRRTVHGSVPPYLYAHTLFMKMKDLLKEVGPPSPEQWSVLHHVFDQHESGLGKRGHHVYAIYLKARLGEESLPLPSSPRARL